MLFLPFHQVRARKHFHTDRLLWATLLENTETWQRKIKVVIKMWQTCLRQEEIYQRQARRFWLLPCLSFFCWGDMLLHHAMWAPALKTEDGIVVCLTAYDFEAPTLSFPECFLRLHLTCLEMFHWADLSPFAQKYEAFKFPLPSKLRRLAESSAEFISEVFWNIKQLTCLFSCWTKFQKKPREYSGYFLTINLTSSDFS